MPVWVAGEAHSLCPECVKAWIPAFAGMTSGKQTITSRPYLSIEDLFELIAEDKTGADSHQRSTV
jgi:hypothetical protein